ncbi:MAG: succinate dehydrogenase cytochrome b subunit [Verrucomicrobia bacterium]|nr:succinate dehydrogenase cytochrome b subunit [Verrucomicrobiota bacterium]
MNSIRKVFGTAVGKKCGMALTGVFLFLFVVGHMVGNLQVFLGQYAINHYAQLLQSNTGVLWSLRICLAAVALTHIYFAITLTLENRAKREVGYEVKELVGASLASRTMFISGSVIFGFIVYHLLHFTTGTTNPEFMTFKDERGWHDVYRMVQTGFSNGWVVAAYVVGVGALGLHLSNGLRAFCQSLGWRFETYASRIDRAAVIVAVVLFVGFAIVPLALFLGGAK